MSLVGTALVSRYISVTVSFSRPNVVARPQRQNSGFDFDLEATVSVSARLVAVTLVSV